LQAIIMGRDDFGMAATRFMAALDIPILQGNNFATVDLFDPLHARKVLAAFGCAFGRLPDNLGQSTKDQNSFLDQAIAGLAEDGKVISVRLALFAEMVKGKPWTPSTLKEVGGMEGVGVTFLEETFTASTALPQHRLHQKAAQAVLKALLPESGMDIKGHMRSQQVLLNASGYGNRPKDFDDLLRILDSEIRLITPTDPEGKDNTDPSTVQPGTKYYQLTHDYLVPSLRDWLTRKLKETRKGRAELLLADRAAVWNARPEKRQLPSLIQWLQIGWHTSKKDWMPPQRKMMRRARWHHAVRGLVVALLLAVATATGLSVRAQVEERRKVTYAAGLVQSLLNADTAQVPAILDALSEYRQWANPLLKEENDKAGVNSRQKLHASLALLPVDASLVKYLNGRLLDAEPSEVLVLRDALFPHKDQLLKELWTAVETPETGKELQRLRAAAALATYDPESEKWAKVHDAVANDLVAVPAVYLGRWMDGFRPVRAKLCAPLSVIFRDAKRRDAERSLATDILADYAADSPHLLADLLMDADERQFAVIYPRLKDRDEQGLPVLTGEIDKKLPPDTPSSDVEREKLAKRQANAAAALLRMNQSEKVWPLLQQSPDPRVRSYLLHRLSPLGVDARAIIKRLDEGPDLTIRRALILSLGEFGEKELPSVSRRSLVPRLQGMYRNEADPGLHAAVEWLLRKWEEKAWLQQVNGEWAKDKAHREKRLQNIQRLLTKDKEKTPPQWYVNGQGQTMVVIPGPVQFLTGSPAKEEGRSANETQHRRRIGRTFALAAKSVTVNEFRQFLRANKLEARFEAGSQVAAFMKQYSPAENGPIILVDWFQASLYCNWLSEQEGIPLEQWCYETNAQSLSREKASAAVMMLLQRHPLVAAGSSSYFHYLVDRPLQVTALRKDYLSLTGYRLPTEAEWEYACRAGAVTGRYYGETEELLPRYGWYVKNSGERAWPVGIKKPNDLGLFDLHGNVWNWCQESYDTSYSKVKDGEAIDDKEGTYSINSQNSRALRGGSFDNVASVVRSSYRATYGPAVRNDHVGFRPARTYR
jgi:formylglycine-generating enzyme required for sulfatase activity